MREKNFRPEASFGGGSCAPFEYPEALEQKSVRVFNLLNAKLRKRCPRPLSVVGRSALIQSRRFGGGLEASFAKKIAMFFGERCTAG